MTSPSGGAPGRNRKRAGRDLAIPPRRFHLFTNVLAGQTLRPRTSSAPDSGPRIFGRDRLLTPVWNRLDPLPAVRQRTARFGTPALVVALLHLNPPSLPNSVCGNPVFEEALPEDDGIASSFCVCDHLFASPAPKFSQIQVPRFSSRTVSQATRGGRWMGTDIAANGFGSSRQVLC